MAPKLNPNSQQPGGLSEPVGVGDLFPFSTQFHLTNMIVVRVEMSARPQQKGLLVLCLREKPNRVQETRPNFLERKAEVVRNDTF